MLSRVLRGVSVVLCLAAAACGGVAPEEVDQGEEAVAPASEADSNDTSAMGPIGGTCGTFQQRCCTGNICYNGLECDPTSGKCLH
jgi:hypothetical protein